MKQLRDLAVLVLGLGDSGLAMARWCARHGARVQVWDSRWDAGAEPPQAAALAADVPGAQRVAGPLGEGSLAGVQLVLKSPGLAPGDARLAPLLAAAAEIGIAVQGELDLYARALADLRAAVGYAPKVLAITGTNGKTTTTALTALLVERAGRRVAVAGNIGPTLLDTLAAALDAEPGLRERLAAEDEAGPEAASPEAGDVTAPLVPGGAHDAAPVTAPGALDDVEPEPVAEAVIDSASEPVAESMSEPLSEVVSEPVTEPAALADDEAPLALVPPPPAAPVFEMLPEVWVLELSSFQLDRVRGFEPSAAAVLNLTQDHLDWHGSMAAYAEAKARVWGRHAVMIVNRDDALVEAEVTRLLTPPAPPVSLTPRGRPRAVKPAKPLVRDLQRFGLNPPQRHGDWGLVVENGMAWLVRAHPQDPTLLGGRRGKPVEDDELHLQRLMPADALRIRGRHNAANALAALALATAIGCPLAPMLHGLREYGGEPHRVEYVATIDGVDAYDDSKGTNVGATVAAIEGLGADREPARLVLILGGDGKGQDFTPLVAPLRRHGRAVALIGRDAEALAAVLAPAVDEAGLVVQRHASLEAATAWAFDQAQPGDAVLLSPACASLDMFRNYAHRAEVFVGAVQVRADERGVGVTL